MKKQKLDYLVLEVTSHALVQHRILGLPIDMAVMTNVTHEHLEYHRTFGRYLKAKLKLFQLANSNKQGQKLGIINADDPQALAFANAVTNTVCYSQSSNSDSTIARPAKLKLSLQSSQYTLKIDNDSYDITCNLPGSFNVANSMAAALVGRALKIKKQDIEAGIKSLTAVEGRMMSIDLNQGFGVIIDFAHTPDSFEKLFRDLRPQVKGKIIVLFGSAGHRDVAKRFLQGEIAGKYADILVLTEEDDRTEDGNQILDAIAKGAQTQGKQAGKNMFLILNRTKAIKKALSLAQSQTDLVLLLGKGHEKSIARKDGEHAWDEVKTTKKFLSQIVGSKSKAKH